MSTSTENPFLQDALTDRAVIFQPGGGEVLRINKYDSYPVDTAKMIPQ